MRTVGAKLLCSDSVPAGFEILISIPKVETGEAWNLWYNVTLSDDPEKWDDQIRAVNTMQKQLGALSDEHRLIRAHMAEFCRYAPSFPDGIDVLCEEIGKGTLTEPVSLGCEGRGLLQFLGHHQDADVDNEVRAYLGAIGEGLRRWMNQERPLSARDRQVFLFLGSQTQARRDFVDRVLSVLDSGDGFIVAMRKLAESQCQKALGNVKKRGRPFNCFGCLPADEAHPKCKCSYAMLVWAGILCADVVETASPPGTAFRAFVQEHVLAYAAALNSWLTGKKASVPTALAQTASVSQDDGARIGATVHELLGGRTLEKTWLAACLLKTIVGNQRWERGEELIDDCPEASSYLRQLAGG